MQQNLRHAPVRRLTYYKKVVFKLWLAALVVMGMSAFTQAADAALLVKFDQSAYHGDVWLQIEGTTATFSATYGGTAITFNSGDLMSVPVKVTDIMNAGGLNVTNSSGAFIYLFYDQPTDQTHPPEPLNPAIASYHQRWQGLELTMTGNSGDQGDLTAIDCFTAPLSITSYATDGTKLQHTDWGTFTAAQIGNQLKQVAVFGGNASPVATDAKGHIYRYIGPSKFNPQNPAYNPIPWPSFIPYIKSIAAAGQTTNISPKPQGFYFIGHKDLTTYHFGANMTATAGGDGSLTVSGAITGSYTGTWIRGNPPIPTGGWPDVTFTFPATKPQYLNFVIYGQADGGLNYVQISGSGWQNFLNFLSTQYLNRSDPSSPTLADPPPATNAPVADTVKGTIIGEVTTGLLGGFFNSDYPVKISDNPPIYKDIKDLPSNQWWSLNPLVAYAEIQSFPYYNVYANVIFTKSGNTVYGVPYSDRFGSGPLVNSVSYGGKNVATWKIGIGAPLPGNIALSGMQMLLLLE
jgi:Beta-1,3-glucanase